MTDTELQSIFEAYLNAFAATSPAEQERLLRSSVAEDVVYTNPGVEGRGLQNLLKHISVFQKRFPGHRFRVNWFRQQHGQMLAEWTQVSEDGRRTRHGPQLWLFQRTWRYCPPGRLLEHWRGITFRKMRCASSCHQHLWNES